MIPWVITCRACGFAMLIETKMPFAWHGNHFIMPEGIMCGEFISEVEWITN